MQYHHVDYKKLEKFCIESFKGYGFNQEEAEQITAVLLEADLSGIESHGVQRMIRYHKEITGGMVASDHSADSYSLIVGPRQHMTTWMRR